MSVIAATLILAGCASCAHTDTKDPETDSTPPYTQNTDVPSDVTEPLTDPVTEPVTEPTPETTAAPEPTFEIITDPAIPPRDEIERVFDHAMNIWGQLHGDNLAHTTDESLTMSGYYPVRDYETIDALREWIRESFSVLLSEHLISNMLNGGLYREIDGRLYVTDATGGSDNRFGDATLDIEVVDSTRVKLTRYVEVWEPTSIHVGDDFLVIHCLVGLSPQEMMLIYEEGRWVFDTFTSHDDLSEYDDGGGVRYELAKEFGDAFLRAYANLYVESEGVAVRGFSLNSYRENPDGTLMVNITSHVRENGELIRRDHTYTARRTDEGELQFIGFLSPERLFTDEYEVIKAVDKNLDILMSGGEFASEEEYIAANPEAFEAIISLGEAALPYLHELGRSFAEYNYIDEYPSMLRAFMAKYAANAIDGSHDITSASPGGETVIKIKVSSFFGEWNPMVGAEYGKIILSDAKGEIRAEHDMMLMYPEVNWSGDGRYAAVTHGDQHYVKATFIIDTESGEVIDLPLAEITDGAADEYYSCRVLFGEWLEDGLIKLRVLIGFGPSADTEPIEGEYVYDLIAGTIVESSFIDK